MNLLTLLWGALIEGTGSHQLAALFARIVPPAFLLVSSGLGSLVEADHGRQHGRHHDDAQDHGGRRDEKGRCRNTPRAWRGINVIGNVTSTEGL